MTARRKDKDMTQGSAAKLLIQFSVPLLLGYLFQQMYNTVDTLVVGNFVGKEALAAVGGTTPIINTLIGSFMGLSMGANVLIAQFYGAHDEKSVHDVVHTTILLSLLLSVVLTVIGELSVPYMLHLMDTPEDVFQEASVYLRIYFTGIPGILLYNMGSGILRAVGDSRRPLYFLVFSAFVDTVLDFVFVLGFNMGVAGAAWSTVIGEVLSSVLVLFVLSRTSGPYRLHWAHLKLNLPILKNIVAIGLPSSIQQGITAFSNVFVQGYINNFGSACMAGYSAYSKVDAFALLPMQSIAMGNTTFVGQNLGAAKIERAKKGITISLLLSIISTVIIIIPLMIFAGPVVSLFNNEAGVIYYGSLYMRFVSPFYLLSCVNQIYAGALRGAGDTKTPMFIMLGSFVVFRQIYLYIVSRVFVNNFIPVLFAYPAGWLVCSTLIYIYFRRVDWQHRRFMVTKESEEYQDFM